MTHSAEVTSNQEILLEPPTADNINEIANPPRKKLRTSRLFRSKETKYRSLKLFIEGMEKDLFSSNNIRENEETIWTKMKR